MNTRKTVLMCLMVFSFFDWQAKSQPNLALYKPFVGLGYSPFQGNQSPNDGTYPSTDQITYDLTNTVRYLASEIRTFGMDGTLSNIPIICAQYNIPCFPCAYLNTNDPTDNSNELNMLIAIGNANYPTTRGLIVGTEAMLNGYDPQTLASNINYVRAMTGGRVPVGTADTQNDLRYNPVVSTNCDFLMANIYAYWAEVPLTNAAEWTIEQWQTVQNTFPGKRIILGEVGWPSAGTNVFWSNPEVTTSVDSQGYFLSQFVEMAKANGIEYFIFDYRDEIWKLQDDNGTIDANWGLVYTNDVKKADLAGLLQAGFALQMQSANPTTATIAVPTYEGNPYTLYGSPDLAPGSFEPVLNFFGQAGTNVTMVTVTNVLPGNAGFFGAGQDF